jgi:prepilin-type processing-associated H-X9-DG protein
MNRTLSSMLCPSDIDRLTNADGHVNYVGNAGSLPLFFLKSGVHPNGLFASVADNNSSGAPQESPSFRFSNVSDGLSNTAAISERNKGIAVDTRDQVDAMTPTTTILAISPEPPNLTTTPRDMQLACAVSDARNLTAGRTIGTGRSLGAQWYLGNPPLTRYNHTMPPNTWTCTAGTTTNNWNGASPPSSRHSGVVNVVLLDGSVKAVKNSVSLPVWWALGSREGGEVISADAL